ncbi:MAG: hypothetical protein GY821_07895 [Gammaproteobacteria bacterium]|nr:hypothetical protein [Gammaproteobacteria bacterium]
MNLTAQLNRQYSENMRKRVLQKTIDSPAEHHSKKSAHQLTDYSHYNKPSTRCYGVEIPHGFVDEHYQSSNESDVSLINPDNNNRPNTSCYGMTHKVVPSDTTAVIKSVEGAELTEIGQLRQGLNKCVTDVEPSTKGEDDQMDTEEKGDRDKPIGDEKVPPGSGGADSGPSAEGPFQKQLVGVQDSGGGAYLVQPGEIVGTSEGITPTEPLQECEKIVSQEYWGSKVKQWPMVEAPAELPQTMHTQVGMMQCYSTTPLESEGSDKNCTFEVHSAQQLINVSESVGVDTVGSASLLEHDQINMELELNKNQQQQRKSPYQKCRTQYMYNKL